MALAFKWGFWNWPVSSRIYPNPKENQHSNSSLLWRSRCFLFQVKQLDTFRRTRTMGTWFQMTEEYLDSVQRRNPLLEGYSREAVMELALEAANLLSQQRIWHYHERGGGWVQTKRSIWILLNSLSDRNQRLSHEYLSFKPIRKEQDCKLILKQNVHVVALLTFCTLWTSGGMNRGWNLTTSFLS